MTHTPAFKSAAARCSAEVARGPAATLPADRVEPVVVRHGTPELAAVRAFLADQRTRFSRDQWSGGYQHMARGGNGWDRALHSGGTDHASALCWYQHVHKPGSKEWRPAVIVRALVAAATAWADAQIGGAR